MRQKPSGRDKADFNLSVFVGPFRFSHKILSSVKKIWMQFYKLFLSAFFHIPGTSSLHNETRFFFKYGPNPASFLFIFVVFLNTMTNMVQNLTRKA